MAAAERALTISGRGGPIRRRVGGGNVSSQIQREIAKLSSSPFEPQFGPAPEFVAPERPQFRTDRGIPNVGELDAAIANIRGRETGTSAGELAGLEGLFEAADPTSRLAEVRKQLETVIGPEALNRAIAGGFGRGPAAAEATTKAGAALTLPILESSFAAKGLANQFKVALEQARFSREQSQQRDLVESVLNKVQAGISVESLNAQERQVLAQFNLSSAGSESQFNLAGAELQSNQEVARSNIGLSTQDRTFNLLDQLRTIREGNLNRAATTANRPTQTFRASGSQGPGLSAPPEISALDRAKTNLLKTQSNAARVASIRAGKQQFSPVAPTPGVLSGGGLSLGLSSSPGGVIPSTSSIASKVLTGPPSTSFAKKLNVSSTFF